MVYEKIFTMTTGKQVKIVVRGYYSAGETTIEPFVEIWVKHRKELFFSPIGLELPRYGFESVGLNNMKDRAMHASGITDQQFEQVMTEFKHITTSSVLL
ncbi:hypothetical protein MUK70_04555 [Dyadobacter chenwenxiniae]|uniref:Uncharacterized protein n=1 Tax=Dyadobacter chenwenxiniae TaxID=2906456 RepID=A0A9X1PNN6_9BACT|nr:hypothetical protein [Dyadobacter chenwenxiniae]MCF0064682.1 hypothetical protein [Dyadobacter chenwenxiniae]UON84264.1 hypothetical protein MUK70_04555 [Dyadobacter chenwenxiniae]